MGSKCQAVCLVLLILAGASGFPRAFGPVGPRVSIDPAITTLGVAGGNFNVSVRVENVTDLYGFQFKLAYNRTVVNATGISIGPFLTSDGWNQIFTSVLVINNTAGMVVVATSRTGISTGVSGNGVLAIVTFTIAPQRSSVLDLMEVKLGDSRAQPLGDGNGDGFVDNVFDGLVRTTVGNIPPFASIFFLPGRPMVGQSVSFDGSGSYDLDGSVVSYRWNFGDISNATGAIVTHSYGGPGTYNVTLIVQDDQGATGSGQVWLVVSEHELAVTRIIVNPAVTTPGTQVAVVVTVANQGLVYETFDLTTYYNGSFIRRSVGTLGPGSAQDYTIQWDTGMVPFGRYRVSANVTVISGEADSSNNVMETSAIFKRSATLSLSLMPGSVSPGSPVSLTGQIVPGSQGIMITLFTRSGTSSWELIANVSTDASGSYRYNWTPTGFGTYEFQSYWGGDTDYVEAFSDVEGLTVVSGSTVPTTLFLWALPPIAALLLLVYILLYKKRRGRFPSLRFWDRHKVPSKRIPG